jgi:hypothetical protein
MSRSLLALRRKICCPTAAAAFRTSSIGRVHEHGDQLSLRNQLAQQRQLFRLQFGREQARARHAAARPAEAGHKAYLDRKIAAGKNDRNRRCRSFGRERRAVTACRDDHRHLTADQIGRHCRQSIKLSLRPAEFDRDILAFDIAGFFVQTLTERRDDRCRLARGPAAKEPDHRHCRLLRARRERPRCRAAEKGNKLTRFMLVPRLRKDIVTTQIGILEGISDVRFGS